MLNRFDFKVERDTPPKTNLEPEDGGKRRFLLETIIFRFKSLVFRE